jgi:hypothetical protein
MDWYIVELIAISSNCILMGIDGDFDSGFEGGFNSGLFD